VLKRFIQPLLVGLVALAIMLVPATAAWANGAHFHSADAVVDSSGALVVSLDERGLGNDNIDYTLTADASAVYACINGGGNHPQATNKETVNVEVSAAASFEPRNGRVRASLSAGPPSAGSFSCPSGQHLELASVAYAGVVLTDQTNGVSVALPDTSRVFFEV